MVLFDPPFTEERGYIAVAVSWFLSQFLKVARDVRKKKPFNVRWLFDTGGMPSSHSASVASVATVVGLYYGFTSIPFLMASIFSLITMFDAAGVRRGVGRQATTLNKILEDLSKGKEVPEEKLKELWGHTPKEVFAGAFLGILIAYLFCGF